MAAIARGIASGSTTTVIFSEQAPPSSPSTRFSVGSLIPQEQEEFDAVPVVQKLERIITRHLSSFIPTEEEELSPNFEFKIDNLSAQLGMAGEKFIEQIKNAGEQTKLTREVLVSHLTGLKKVLSLGHNVMKEPWKAGQFALEKCSLQLYCAAYNIAAASRIAQGKIQPLNFQELGAPHAFAQEVLAWIEELGGLEQAEEQIPHSCQETVRERIQRMLLTVVSTTNLLGMPELDLQELEEDEEPITSWTEMDVESMDLELAIPVLLKFRQTVREEIQKRQREAQEKANAHHFEHLERRTQGLKDNLAHHDASSQFYLDQMSRDTQQFTAIFAASVKKSEEQQTALIALHVQTKNEVRHLREDVSEERRKVNWAHHQISTLNSKVANLEATNYSLWCQMGHMQNELNNSGGGCVIS